MGLNAFTAAVLLVAGAIQVRRGRYLLCRHVFWPARSRNVYVFRFRCYACRTTMPYRDPEGRSRQRGTWHDERSLWRCLGARPTSMAAPMATRSATLFFESPRATPTSVTPRPTLTCACPLLLLSFGVPKQADAFAMGPVTAGRNSVTMSSLSKVSLSLWSHVTPVDVLIFCWTKQFFAGKA